MKRLEPLLSIAEVKKICGTYAHCYPFDGSGFEHVNNSILTSAIAFGVCMGMSLSWMQTCMALNIDVLNFVLLLTDRLASINSASPMCC